MKLTIEEQRMLNGENGEIIQKMMELLVVIGEAFDAEKMVRVDSVHIPAVSLSTLRQGGRNFIENIANSGATVKVFTTANPSSLDLTQWPEMGIPETEVRAQVKVNDAICRMGAIPCGTCSPYLIGNIPRLGQHLAWGEASAIVFANSVMGARTNAEGGPSALASALTGRTAEFGLHLNQNRFGNILIRVTADLRGVPDYGTLGYWTGTHCQELVPVFTDLPLSISVDELKMLSNGIACISRPTLFHAVGITPQAESEEEALGHKKAVGVLEFGERELNDTMQNLSRAKTTDVSWVAFGCPHCSINEIMTISGLLDGKKVNSGVELWVCTSQPVKQLSDSVGCTKVIERAGGKIVCDTCPIVFSKSALSKKGFRSIVTNSSALATYISSIPEIEPHFGTYQQCINAAVSGRW